MCSPDLALIASYHLITNFSTVCFVSNTKNKHIYGENNNVFMIIMIFKHFVSVKYFICDNILTQRRQTKKDNLSFTVQLTTNCITSPNLKVEILVWDIFLPVLCRMIYRL